MQQIILEFTDEQIDDFDAGLSEDGSKDRIAKITAYLQGQNQSIAGQFANVALRKRLELKGLPAKLAEAGLDAEALVVLEAHADEKIVAKAALEARAALAAAPLKAE